MITVKSEFFTFGRVSRASGTSKDVRLWFKLMMEENGTRGKLVKRGDGQAEAIVEIGL